MHLHQLSMVSTLSLAWEMSAVLTGEAVETYMWAEGDSCHQGIVVVGRWKCRVITAVKVANS